MGGRRAKFCLLPPFNNPIPVTNRVTESRTMKQFFKLLLVAVCMVAVTACNGNTVYLEEQLKGNSSNSADTELAQEKEPSALGLAKQDNPDAVAWLAIPGTDIDNPVIQTTNNEDYLRRNETGNDDVWGCYFADSYSNLASKDTLLQNTVIYGHSESTENPDGKRFTQLFRYLDLEFVKENPCIYLTVGEDVLSFQIFSVFFTDTNFYYIDPNPTDQGFKKFMTEVNAKNEFAVEGMEVTEFDKLLTLSTCAYRYDTEKTGNHRLVVMARLVDENTQMPRITANLNPQRP